MIYDALIIGGGPAGATAACLLAKQGWTVQLLEKSEFPRHKVCGEYISASNFSLFRYLGIENNFLDLCGPSLKRIGLYSGNHTLSASMFLSGPGEQWGCALGREHLDMLLLDTARHAGVDVLQPFNVIKLTNDHGVFTCHVSSPKNSEIIVTARTVILANGSGNAGSLQNTYPKRLLRASDLLAFKTHFIHADLAEDILPVLAFPGGYGGMLRTDHERVCMAFCIRRDMLKKLRTLGTGNAAEIVLAHIRNHCTGIREVLENAHQQYAWLATGTIRPGIHRLYQDGKFAVGNAAGEAHPIIGEGISMAMQGAWLLAGILQSNRAAVLRGNTKAAGKLYKRAWYRAFAPRIYNAAIFAQMAMRPTLTRTILPVFQKLPQFLTVCSRLSGKAAKVISVNP